LLLELREMTMVDRPTELDALEEFKFSGRETSVDQGSQIVRSSNRTKACQIKKLFGLFNSHSYNSQIIFTFLFFVRNVFSNETSRLVFQK
jgi:hypothetical protein